MNIPSSLVLCLCLCFQGSFQQSNETHYIAAVVEFNSLYQPNLTANDIVNNNSIAYQEIILSEEAKSADIIVFPESTLNGMNVVLTYVPTAEEKISPCDTPTRFEKFLVDISCKAKEVKKYVIINLTEKEDCTKESQAAKKDPRPCAKNGLSIFNTNVVFDRTGTVISTYRKVHLFGEYGKNITYVPDHSSFTTDFNVTFGHFVCFDILFQTPAQDLVEQGITDFVYPTMWFSELPFLTAVQTQMAWAYGNDVNLLAANSGLPAVGSTGTGIYAGKEGIVTAVVNDDPVRKIYVAAVPKKIKGKRSKPVYISPTGAKSTDQMFIIIDNSITNFTTKVINSSLNDPQVFHVCSKEFCCDFNVTKKALNLNAEDKAYEFRVGAFNDFRSFQGIDETYLRTCGVFACQNSSLSSCGATFNTKKDGTPVSDYFEHIEIKADYPKVKNMLIQPTSSHRDLLPIPVDQFDFNVKENSKTYSVTLSTKGRTDLLAFGIFTNYYKNSSSAVVFSTFLVMVSLLISKIV